MGVRCWYLNIYNFIKNLSPSCKNLNNSVLLCHSCSSLPFLLVELREEHPTAAVLGKAQILQTEPPDGRSEPGTWEEGQRSASPAFSLSSGSTSRLVEKSRFSLLCTRLDRTWKTFPSHLELDICLSSEDGLLSCGHWFVLCISGCSDAWGMELNYIQNLLNSFVMTWLRGLVWMFLQIRTQWVGCLWNEEDVWCFSSAASSSLLFELWPRSKNWYCLSLLVVLWELP